MDKIGLFLLILMVNLWEGSGWQKPLLQSGEAEYFEEKGHWVTGELLEAYNNVPNPQQIYGYPVTDVFPSTDSRVYFQYFEKARLELHLDAPPGERVRTSPLGQFLYTPEQPTPIPGNSACKAFPEKGFLVCLAFLDFFEAHGGAAQFGYPISNMEFRNNKIVQYFQKARFEWRPEFPPGQRVILADLGTEYFFFSGEDPELLEPRPENNTINTGIMSLKVRAFPERAVASLKGAQTLYIIVQDQRLLPVQDAQVSFVIRMPSGEEDRIIIPTLTDKNGITQFTFSYTTSMIGMVEIWVAAVHDKLQARTSTSFRLWW